MQVTSLVDPNYKIYIVCLRAQKNGFVSGKLHLTFRFEAYRNLPLKQRICMARFSFICCTFLMLSLCPCRPALSSVARSSLLSSAALSRKAPLNLATVRAKSTAAIEDVSPAKIAAQLVALLGSEEEARSVEPDLARKMLSCLRFLVPNAVSLPEAFSVRRGLESRKLMLNDKRINELIWWPPSAVMDLARSAVEWGADPDVIYQALNSTHYQVMENSRTLIVTHDRYRMLKIAWNTSVNLPKPTFGRRFLNKDMNMYMSFLFETVATLSPSAGLNISLNRYDLFHGHLFLASNTGRLGSCFMPKNTRHTTRKLFQYTLAIANRGSNVAYDNSVNLRNILWLAPLPDCSNRKCSKQWLAPGSIFSQKVQSIHTLCALFHPDDGSQSVIRNVDAKTYLHNLIQKHKQLHGALVVLDAHPGGVIYEDLVGEWVQEVRTIYEDDFGDAILDVNYLNVANSPSENKIYLC